MTKVEECRLTEKINKLSEEFGTTDIERMTLLMLLNLDENTCHKITEAEAQTYMS